MEAGTSDEESSELGRDLEEALVHPTRAWMFAELTKQQLELPKLAKLVNEPLARVAYHYRVLERFGGIQAAEELRGN